MIYVALRDARERTLPAVVTASQCVRPQYRHRACGYGNRSHVDLACMTAMVIRIVTICVAAPVFRVRVVKLAVHNFFQEE